MKDYIKQLIQPEVAVQEVTILPLPIDIRQSTPPFRKHGYTIASEFILNLRESGYDDLSYVLGYRNYILPIEHTIIRVGNSYYDPVGKINKLNCFCSIFELTISQLENYLVENDNTPPTLNDWLQQATQ